MGFHYCNGYKKNMKKTNKTAVLRERGRK